MKLAVTFSLVCAAVTAAAQSANYDRAGNLVSLGAGNPGPPTVRGPTSILAQPGDVATLSVAATGSNLQFRWFFNSSPLPNATGSTLVLNSLSAQNLGQYFLIASNSFGVVTSQVAQVDFDTDRDGLGDSWELAYFGSLTNQTGAMDWDQDGVSNLLEYQDGSNPTNSQSFRVRLDLRAFNGSVSFAPNAESYALNSTVTLTAVPDPGLSFISWSGALTGTNNPATLNLAGNVPIQATFGLPLAAALNTTNAIITGGSGGWFGQTEITHDGESAAGVAPPLVDTEAPFLETTLITKREGTASFQWKIDGEHDDALTLTVNGLIPFPTRGIFGVTDWQLKTIYLPAGTNTLRWSYARNGGGWTETGSLTKPRDSAYLDQLVVTEYANPQLDSDHNGLPDLWEYRYFDQIGNDPNADPDGDGVTTATELADGTNPNDSSSVLPRVSFTIEGNGSALAAPGRAAYQRGDSITNTAAAANGWRFIAWIGPFDNNYFFPKLNTNNPATDRLNTSKNYRAVFGTPPGEAVDAPNLAWTTSADLPWFGQSLVTHDGVMAAQSGLTVDQVADSQSWLETKVTGPGTLSFFWKTSSASTNDYFTLLIDSIPATDPLSGPTAWQPVELSLPAGDHNLRWLFQRYYGYDTNALNTAWLDQVNFTAGATKPKFLQTPPSLTGFEGQNLSLHPALRGTPPITCQVLLNGVALSQPDANPILTVSNLTPAMAGQWVVRAQNASGTTDSAAFPVTILPRPRNDQFANAATLVDSAPGFDGYTIGATAEPGEPSHAGYAPRATVWHRWTAPLAEGIHFTAVATNPPDNLILAVYTGATLSSLKQVVAGDTYPELTNGVELARVDLRWRAAAGVTYWIAADAGDQGAFYHLSWQTASPPPNDAFANRIATTGSYVLISGDNTFATAEPGEPPVFSIPPFFYLYASNTLWWSWTAPATGNLLIQDQNDDVTALISMFTGTTLATLKKVVDPMSGQNSLDVTAGNVYAISADSQSGDTGRFTFLLMMNALTLRAVQTRAGDPMHMELLGPPQTLVVVQFSPNLRDWYPWSTNNIPSEGLLKLTFDPPAAPSPDPNGDVFEPLPSATKRFFRVLVP